jgi:hypothetical protein
VIRCEQFDPHRISDECLAWCVQELVEIPPTIPLKMDGQPLKGHDDVHKLNGKTRKQLFDSLRACLLANFY